jgi:Xaa-Pro dipeptidase
MTRVSRRGFFALTAAGAALAASEQVLAAKAAASELSPITRDAQPISTLEHGARLAKIQGLMQQKKIAAFLVEAGPSLEYFTGIRWHRSERTTAALIPADGPCRRGDPVLRGAFGARDAQGPGRRAALEGG